MKKIYIVSAVDENYLIGNDNSLPWNIEIDKKHFRKLTLGKSVIMGRKTFQSIGKALEKRKNIILTRNTSFSVEGCFIAHSIEEALNFADEEVFVIGGEEIYKEFLPLAQKIFLTKIHAAFMGNKYFPEINKKDWKLEESKKIFDKKSNLFLEFQIYKRIEDI
jgi:dihydrofolate reductase